jgi:hypothetical protein
MRLEERELCADLVKVEWMSKLGPAHSEWAILEDISASGACLQCESPVPPETLVFLEFPGNNRCEARVRYCKIDRTNFLLGVHFEQGFRWSRRKFKPEHLLQFRLRCVKK